MTSHTPQALQDAIGYHFKCEDHLLEALTHRSYLNESDMPLRDNERLEFLGDAVLEYLVTRFIFLYFEHAGEGELTQLRSAMVRTDALAKLARDLDLGAYLRMGRGEEANGGRKRDTLLCRAYEALVGAVYLDGGIDAVQRVFLPAFEQLLQHIVTNSLHKDARSLLQERSQAELRITPSYRVVEAEGPEHEREYTAEVLIGEWVIGSGKGKSKRTAAQASARHALQKVERQGWPPEVLAYAAAQLHENVSASDEFQG